MLILVYWRCHIVSILRPRNQNSRCFKLLLRYYSHIHESLCFYGCLRAGRVEEIVPYQTSDSELTSCRNPQYVASVWSVLLSCPRSTRFSRPSRLEHVSETKPLQICCYLMKICWFFFVILIRFSLFDRADRTPFCHVMVEDKSL